MKEDEKSTVLKIDVDGVLRNVVPTMCRLYDEEYGESVKPEDVTEYDVSKTFVKCLDAPDFFFRKHAREVFLESEPCPGAANALRKIKSNHAWGFNFKIVICTWQIGALNKEYTLKFLAERGMEYDDVCFLKDKSLVRGAVMVDDCPEVLESEPAGTAKVLIDAPYNRSYVLGEHFRRCRSLLDFANNWGNPVNDENFITDFRD